MLNKIKNLAFIALGVVMLLGTQSCNERIDAGHEGIKVSLYGTDKGVQTVDYNAFSVNAKDGSVFTVDPTISLRVEPGKSPQIFAKYRKTLDEVVKNTISNHIKDVYRIEFNKYSTDEIISSREKFEQGVQDKMSEFFKKEGFILEQLTSGIQPPSSITDAIELKNAAVQKSQQAENELRVVEAQAKKLIVQAEAEAKANQLKQQTLTSLLVQQQFIEKWNGSTPLYGNSPVLFQNIK